MSPTHTLLSDILAVLKLRAQGHAIVYSDRITPFVPRISQAIEQPDTDDILAQFAALPSYGSINIVCQPGTVRLYAIRRDQAPKYPVIGIEARTLSEGMRLMIEAFR